MEKMERGKKEEIKGRSRQREREKRREGKKVEHEMKKRPAAKGVIRDLCVDGRGGTQCYVRVGQPTCLTKSQELLLQLYRMCERPEYQVRLRWHDEGDLLVYDNRNTNHYAVSDYGNMGARALHHIALLGEPTMNPDGKIIDGVGQGSLR